MKEDTVAAEQVDERLDPIELFSPAVQKDFQGLAFLGALTETFRFCGHTFSVETLRPNVQYAIGQAMGPYRDTLAEPNAYAAFHTALALTSVDGKRMVDLCPPIGDNLGEFVTGRFTWLTVDTGWYQPLIDYIFVRYIELEKRSVAAIKELQDLSLRGPATLQPSPDSLIAMAPSEDKTDSDIPLWDGSNSNFSST